MMNQEPASLYQVLGVERQASTEAIEAAFAALRISAFNDAEESIRERIQYAYDVLSDPQRRSLYDSLLAETAAPALALEVIASAGRLAVTDSPQLLYLLIHVRPQGDGAEHQRPLNLCLVIDRSTSMRGERLEKVLAAVRLIIAKLGPEDVLSLVSFSDRAEVVLPAGTMSGRAVQTGFPVEEVLNEALERIVPSGGTEIFQGLSAGVREMRQVDLENYTNQLILLTDGHTYGDAPECLALAQQAAEANVGFSAFGIGVDWNDQFLDALVAPSGGQSDYIEKPEEIITHLENRIRGLGNVYAQEMRLLPKWPRQVKVLECFKLSPFAQPLPLDGDYLALGQMEGRAPLSLLLELQIAPQPVPARIKIPLTMTAAIPSTGPASADAAGKSRPAGIDEQTFSDLVQLVVLQSSDGVEEPPVELVDAVRLLTLHRMYEKAWNEAATGQLRAAAKRMDRLTTRLLESGELDLAHQAHQEAQRIARLGTMSLEGHKQLKYGTRSLMGQRKK